MATIPSGHTITWVTGSKPATGCLLCYKHRRGTGESDCNGTTGYISLEGRGELCGDCAQEIKALAP